MFDFLNSKLISKIRCGSPAMDNYEIENLISDNYAERMRGFIAYSSIKPPVEVEIEFICPINMHYITLNTTVGSQKCSGIEIFAKNSSIGYTSICKSVYDNPGVVFCNSKMYSNTNRPPNVNLNYHLGFFKSNTFNCFLNACSIKILIFRTEKSVPCLGSVQIWAKTSRACSEITKETINRIIQKSLQITVSNTIPHKNDVEFKIPDDFKDDLTYETMSIPMTLPSGKTIDQSTLEKHMASEISFGRKPCDPFTGIKFTNTLKPVVNVGLKSRIDMFLLQNSHREELLNVKHVLGGNGRNSCSSENVKKRKAEADELDELILKAKESPSFHNFTSENIPKNVCLKCKCKDIETIYELPCKHKYCRSCILTICEILKCPVCRKEFVRSDISKCNL